LAFDLGSDYAARILNGDGGMMAMLVGVPLVRGAASHDFF
jgi:hypothetical protein